MGLREDIKGWTEKSGKCIALSEISNFNKEDDESFRRILEAAEKWDAIDWAMEAEDDVVPSDYSEHPWAFIEEIVELYRASQEKE